MSSGTFVDRIDPFAKRSLKKKSRKSQGSSRYRNSQDVELQQLPPLKGMFHRPLFDDSIEVKQCPFYSHFSGSLQYGARGAVYSEIEAMLRIF
jgi:hypothetical protein